MSPKDLLEQIKRRGYTEAEKNPDATSNFWHGSPEDRAFNEGVAEFLAQQKDAEGRGAI